MRDIDSKHTGYSGYKDIWGRNLSEIDQRIQRYADKTGDRLYENMKDLEQDIRNWFDKQDLDDKAREEWNKLKMDSKLLSSKLKHRIDELVDRGKIKLNHWTSSGSSN